MIHLHPWLFVPGHLVGFPPSRRGSIAACGVRTLRRAALTKVPFGSSEGRRAAVELHRTLGIEAVEEIDVGAIARTIGRFSSVSSGVEK